MGDSFGGGGGGGSDSPSTAKKSSGLLSAIKRRSSKGSGKSSPQESPRASPLYHSTGDDSEESVAFAASRLHAMIDEKRPAARKKMRSAQQQSNKKKRRSMLVTYDQLEHLVQSQHQQYRNMTNTPIVNNPLVATRKFVSNDNADNGEEVLLRNEVERLQSKLDHLATYIIEDHNTVLRIEQKIDTYDDANGTDCRACCGFI